MERRPYTFDRVVRIVFSICGMLVIIYLLDVLKGVLLPFLVACLISYMLEPIVKWNMKWTHLRGRFIPVMLTLLEACVLAGAFCFAFFPYVANECVEMTEMVKAYANKQIQIPYISESIHQFLRENIDFDGITKLLSREEWKV